jgi:hypothetical protein
LHGYTPLDLEERIRAIQNRRRCTVEEALAEMARTIGEDTIQLRGWWSTFGPWWLSRAYAEIVASRTATPATPPAPDPPRAAPDRDEVEVPSVRLPERVAAPAADRPLVREVAPRPRPRTGGKGASWLTMLDPLDMVLPVGVDGAKKPLRLFDADDCRSVAGLYRRVSSRVTAIAEKWEEVAALVGHGTLGDLAVSGQVNVADLGVRASREGFLAVSTYVSGRNNLARMAAAEIEERQAASDRLPEF